MRSRDAFLLFVAAACNESNPAPNAVKEPVATPTATAITTAQLTATLCPAGRVKEAEALRCSNGSASRVRDTLFVRLGNGQVVRYVENRGREMSSYYSYEGLMHGSAGASSYHLVERSGGEVTTVIGIEIVSGDTITFGGQLTMSPDGTRFLVNLDADLCGEADAFAVWRITMGRPRREWNARGLCRSAKWIAAPAQWRSADTVAVTSQVPADPTKGGWTETLALLVRHDSSWSFVVRPSSFCQDTSETIALRCAGGELAQRRGDTLLLHLVPALSAHPVPNAHRDHVTRWNSLESGEQAASYRYYGYLRGEGYAAFHVLDYQGYESGAVELIDATTGDSLMVVGYPMLSPDGARFAAAAASYETCEGNTQLDVWRVAGNKPSLEFTVHPFDCSRDTGWWPTDLAWRSADTLGFVRNTLSTDAARRKRDDSDKRAAMLVRRATGWTLDSASVAGLPRQPADSL